MSDELKLFYLDWSKGNIEKILTGSDRPEKICRAEVIQSETGGVLLILNRGGKRPEFAIDLDASIIERINKVYEELL